MVLKFLGGFRKNTIFFLPPSPSSHYVRGEGEEEPTTGGEAGRPATGRSTPGQRGARRRAHGRRGGRAGVAAIATASAGGGAPSDGGNGGEGSDAIK
jgi:hypothetical protein